MARIRPERSSPRRSGRDILQRADACRAGRAGAGGSLPTPGSCSPPDRSSPGLSVASVRPAMARLCGVGISVYSVIFPGGVDGVPPRQHHGGTDDAGHMADNGLNMVIVDGSANGWVVNLAANTMSVISDQDVHGRQRRSISRHILSVQQVWTRNSTGAEPAIRSMRSTRNKESATICW